jgi:hypothetical protein
VALVAALNEERTDFLLKEFRSGRLGFLTPEEGRREEEYGSDDQKTHDPPPCQSPAPNSSKIINPYTPEGNNISYIIFFLVETRPLWG